MATPSIKCETLVIGAGLAGLCTALELLQQGRAVTLLDRAAFAQWGGQANDAFGGMLLSETPEQRRQGIRDSAELFFHDWQQAAAFQPHEQWGLSWAKAYSEYNRRDIYDWLSQQGIRFVPAVQWVERGNHGDGNSLPRYHIAWGCGRGVAQTLLRRLREHRNAHLLRCLEQHQVSQLLSHDGRVSGCCGQHQGQAFSVHAEHTVICGGGINGNLAKVRQHWDQDCYGAYPENILNGTFARADGALHDMVDGLGGQVCNLGHMWNYAAGIAHPNPEFERHGLSLIPPRSALWLDASGQRIGPMPLVSGFDTHDLCKQIGHLPGQYGWLLLNARIADRELAISGTDSNPLFRDRRLLALAWQLLRGNRAQTRWLMQHCPDVIHAHDLSELARKMRTLCADNRLQPEQLQAAVARYDAQIARGPALHNDEQLRRIQQLRQWRSERMRTCHFQSINAPAAGPLIAIRTRVISRKSMGGMLTDLSSRVLNAANQPVPGLYACGEAAGFGGGGISGRRSLEGTFLSNCIFTARRAAQCIATGG
ncbi:FAD-dependent oxidoreductase [Atopomonas sediminilitoris]|uniref:FAD-dependent oxidoreductase n=1 Tax=Atopomonas sediminilitoris TaxID=2919919 RepID=UPI001F4E70AA|nr:FAD-dependent oxidoreductase [Atopomonas sediminilitoris]MCJ8168446.1 FAD-dependent oxidoreductase [Atopomonas sediminilitoris]